MVIPPFLDDVAYQMRLPDSPIEKFLGGITRFTAKVVNRDYS